MKKRNRNDRGGMTREYQYIELVCRGMRLPVSGVLSKSRKHELCEARQVCSYVLARHMAMPYTQIACLLNYRSHASPWRDFREVTKFLGFDRDFIERVKPVLHEAERLAEHFKAEACFDDTHDIFDFYSEAAFV